MSKIFVDQVDPKTATTLTLGTTGDTVDIPTGVGLSVTDEVKTNKISPATGVAFALGDSGDTFTVPSGATIVNSGTATGFGGGKIGQVVSTLWSGSPSASSSSTTYAQADTGLTTAITPTATSSKIFVTCTGGFSYVPDGTRMTCNMYYKVTSGGTYVEVGDTSYMMGLSGSGHAGVQSTPHAYSFLHSPSSVSELYYSLFFRRQSGSDGVLVTTTNTVTFGIALTLMEVLA